MPECMKTCTLDPMTIPSTARNRALRTLKVNTTWFASQVASFCDAGIQKLVPRYDKCLNNGANYVKK
jgi:hypothetical protein